MSATLRFLSARFHRPVSFRSHLVSALLLTMVPLFIFSVVLIYLIVQNERTTFQRGATERTLALLTAVDTELRSSITSLEVLAASRSLENDDLRSFYDEAARVLKTQPGWLTIHLALPTGQQVVNVRQLFGAKLPAIVDGSSFKRILEARKPTVGQLREDTVVKQQAFPVRVPVLQAGAIKYVLTAVVDPQVISSLLLAQRLPRDWIGAVLDGNRRFVTRTVDPQKNLGQLASQSLRAALDSAPEGWFEGTTLESRNAYTAYNRSAFSGWTVAIGIPSSVVEASYQSWLRYLAYLGIMFLSFVLALAWILSARTAKSIGSLALVASDLASGKKATNNVPDRIAEVEQVKESLLNAGRLIHERSEALRQATERLAAELADLQELQKISAKFIEGGSLDLLYGQILDAAAAMMHSDMASLQMFHSGQNELQLLAHIGFHPESAEFWQSVKVDSSSSCAEALRTGQRVIVEDITTCNFITAADLEAYRKSGIHAVQSTPLMSRAGRLLGMISNHWRETHRPSEDDFRPLDILARQAADLIERKQAEEALLDTDRRKDEFLAVLGHELRNPLGIISTVAELMHKRTAANTELEELRDIITRQVRQMARLLDELLDISRIARGQIRLKKEPCDLTEVVGKTVEDHRSLLEASGLHIKTELPDESLWVMGDRIRLAQIVGNALQNANKFTDRGGAVTIRLAKATEAQTAILTVRDTGIGMEPELLARAFEPFIQAEHSIDRSRGGLGLGLALVKGLVELQEGQVAIASNGPGHGVELTIQFPLIDAPAQAAMAVEPAYESACLRRVLIIEDSPIAARSTRMFLMANGHTVEVAHDGQTGIEMARRFRPEVVLCDIGLPGLDGYGVGRALRMEPGLNGVYLIAVTGYGQEEDQRRAREAGFDGHLTKPIDFAELEQMLATLAFKSEVARVYA